MDKQQTVTQSQQPQKPTQAAVPQEVAQPVVQPVATQPMQLQQAIEPEPVVDPNDTSKKQLAFVLEMLEHARTNDKLVFIKGGWNIDLQYGEQTRAHGDVDLHYDVADSDFWRVWFESKQFWEDKQEEYHSIYYSPENFQVDMGAFDFEPTKKIITWKEGSKSNLENVIIHFNYKSQPMVGVQLEVEKYLKEKHPDFGKRGKDMEDIKIINQILNR